MRLVTKRKFWKRLSTYQCFSIWFCSKGLNSALSLAVYTINYKIIILIVMQFLLDTIICLNNFKKCCELVISLHLHCVIKED